MIDISTNGSSIRSKLQANVSLVSPELTYRMQCLVSIALHTATMAHLAHFATTSLAVHKALHMYYEDIVDAIDVVAEAFQGYAGVPLPVLDQPSQVRTFALVAERAISASIQLLQQEANVLAAALPSLANPVQNVETICQQTLYRLTLVD